MVTSLYIISFLSSLPFLSFPFIMTQVANKNVPSPQLHRNGVVWLNRNATVLYESYTTFLEFGWIQPI